MDSQVDLWTEVLKCYLKFGRLCWIYSRKVSGTREDGVGPNLDSDLRCWRENRCIAINSWWIDFLMR
jgi:hypothetical protein